MHIKQMITYALDFESYYDSECSITTLGPRGYFSHPQFDAYMVTVVGDDGFVYAGCPRQFDWSMLDGHVLLSHNASFDESLYLYGVEVGWFGPCTPAEWHCTADMTAFLGLPRSLKNASAAVFGLEISKTTRDNMKGRQWNLMTDDFKKEVTEYAIKDSELCLRLWQELSDRWPQTERDISELNRKVGQRGIPIDTTLLKKNLEQIRTELFNAEQSIPWVGDSTPLSRKAFNNQCRAQGIVPPASLAAGNEEADKWFATFQEACPWARAVQNYRRINALLRKLEAFDGGTMPDGRYYGGLMYCGANPTARFSGSGGNLNLQNLPREEMFGVNFRHMIKPKDGYKLIVADLSQIEVRTLCWLAEDRKALDLIRDSDDIYHAFGVLLGLHDPANGQLKDFDPKLRHKIKSIVLGCFGPETKVLTDRGWVDIVGVRDTDKVWDGTQWVNHEGLLHQGVQETISRFGVEATSDHEILTEHGWREWNEVQRSEKDLKSALVMASLPSCHTNEQRETMAGLDGTRWSNVRAAGVGLLTAIICKVEKLLDVIVAPNKHLRVQQCVNSDMLNLYQTQRIGKDCSIELAPSTIGVTTRTTPDTTTMVVAEFGYMSLGSAIGQNFLPTSSHLMGGINHIFNSIGLTITKVTSRIIYGLLPRCRTFTIGGLLRAFKKESKSWRRKSEVYDLKNCGPNNRFMIKTDFGPILVHNCGYGMGATKFSAFSGLSMEEAEKAVKLYRERMPTVPKFWRSLDQNMATACAVGEPFELRLPSGRALRYGKIKRMKEAGSINRFRHIGKIVRNGQLRDFQLWGGILTENMSQGLARDIFSDMMLRVDAAGFPVILHVHDEMVCEVPEAQAEEALAKILEIMSTPPSWIPDIPVAAEGHICDLYSK